ncbi:helix-turn-helix domain-containing protein [Lacticaseibacillus nasuensis]|uniref:helix-turn-helix domain-containing protein n=1 Tax=Lacticaseibacillus nasuensis TaxID=944671 RepID=UPI000AC52D42
MTTWNEYKNTMTSFTPEELSVMDTLTYLQAERIRRGISQREFADKIGMKQPHSLSSSGWTLCQLLAR